MIINIITGGINLVVGVISFSLAASLKLLANVSITLQQQTQDVDLQKGSVDTAKSDTSPQTNTPENASEKNSNGIIKYIAQQNVSEIAKTIHDAIIAAGVTYTVYCLYPIYQTWSSYKEAVTKAWNSPYYYSNLVKKAAVNAWSWTQQQVSDCSDLVKKEVANAWSWTKDTADALYSFSPFKNDQNIFLKETEDLLSELRKQHESKDVTMITPPSQLIYYPSLNLNTFIQGNQNTFSDTQGDELNLPALQENQIFYIDQGAKYYGSQMIGALLAPSSS